MANNTNATSLTEETVQFVQMSTSSQHPMIQADSNSIEKVTEQQPTSFLVAFAEPTDPANPKDWPSGRKWLVTSVLSVSGFNRIMVSTIMAPALNTIASELHMNSIESVMSMSVYLLATAFGPLAIGPLSEFYGRKPVLHATNVWFLLWNIVCGFARNKGTLITARLLAGFGASAINALGGGVLGDLWRPEQRGQSLGLYLLIPLPAVAIGPMVGGYITEYANWRWMFWSTSCFQAVMVVLSLVAYRETYGPTILQIRARKLRRATGNTNFRTAVETLDGDRSACGVLTKSLSRPIRLLLFHPIIQIQACLSAFCYGITYLVLSSFSDLWTVQYKESLSTSGLHYVAICLGELLGAQVTGPFMDFAFRRLKARKGGLSMPEFHIPMMAPGAVLTPIGLLIYGWAAEKHAHWLMVDFGVTILCFGMQMCYQALQAYVIDSYPDHTSSASAASQFLCSLTAFGFPLFAPKMYEALGYGWGNSLLAFVAVTIAVPAPLLIWVFGARLRIKATSSY